MAGRFIEDRVEQKLALLEPPARQPLDLHEELRAEAAQDLLGLRLVAFEEERGENPLAPGLVMAIIRAERLMHGGAKVSAQLLELRPQLLGGQLLIDDAGELPRAKAPQVGGEEIHSGPPQPVAQDRVVGNLLQVPGEAGVVQLAQVPELLAGQPARAGQPVVEVDRQAVDAHLRAEHHPFLGFAGLGESR